MVTQLLTPHVFLAELIQPGLEFTAAGQVFPWCLYSLEAFLCQRKALVLETRRWRREKVSVPQRAKMRLEGLETALWALDGLLPGPGPKVGKRGHRPLCSRTMLQLSLDEMERRRSLALPDGRKLLNQ